MLGIYIDPMRFGKSNHLDRSLRDFIDFVHETRPVDGHKGVLVPGEVENLKRKIAHREGVSLPGSVWADLQRTAERLHVTY